MISQPMNGFTDEQIVETRNRFLEFAKNLTFVKIETKEDLGKADVKKFTPVQKTL